ncbi:NAD(P)-dependent oxidoreductase [archaeon]|nr:NAD(P)-dependent oxidoreductase [archaeon]
MAKVALTGSKGRIGTILTQGLEHHELTTADLPETDIRDYQTTLDLLQGQDAVIHLAWNQNPGNWMSERTNPENSLMFENIYQAALEQKVRRVIMASSVHVERYLEWDKGHQITVNQIPEPGNPYGAQKILMENLGGIYAKKRLEVICIRFGGVCPSDSMPWEDLPIVGLTYPDCIDLVETCLTEDMPPETNIEILYGISNNRNGIHDLSNYFNWIPKQDAADFYKTQ